MDKFRRFVIGDKSDAVVPSVFKTIDCTFVYKLTSRQNMNSYSSRPWMSGIRVALWLWEPNGINTRMLWLPARPTRPTRTRNSRFRMLRCWRGRCLAISVPLFKRIYTEFVIWRFSSTMPPTLTGCDPFDCGYSLILVRPPRRISCCLLSWKIDRSNGRTADSQSDSVWHYIICFICNKENLTGIRMQITQCALGIRQFLHFKYLTKACEFDKRISTITKIIKRTRCPRKFRTNNNL